MTLYSGEIVRLKAVFTDFDGTAIVASSIELKIYDSNNTLVGDAIITGFSNPATGSYYYDYTIPITAIPGIWRARWKMTNSGKDSVEYDSFPVISG